MRNMRRVLKKLDRYVCAADVFEIYEDETGIAFLDSIRSSGDARISGLLRMGMHLRLMEILKRI